MTEKVDYEYALDGSNVINHMRKGDDGKSVAHIVVARLDSAISVFKNLGVGCKIFLDEATLQQAKKGKRPLVGSLEDLQSLIDENNIETIHHDGPMAKFAIKNKIPIVTNDQFKGWISGKTKIKQEGVTPEDWKNLGEQKIGFKFAKNSDEIIIDTKIQSKSTISKEPKTKVLEGSNYLDHIRSRLQSLDDRTQSQTTKINNINSIVLDLSSLVKDLATSGTNSNSSALIPCKFEDEFGQSHLCLLGENLHIWQDGKWIEIAIGGNTKLLD
jgi:hypothetical protein